MQDADGIASYTAVFYDLSITVLTSRYWYTLSLHCTFYVYYSKTGEGHKLTAEVHITLYLVTRSYDV